MPVKNLTAEQANRLQDYITHRYEILPHECCAEAAIRVIDDLEERIRLFKAGTPRQPTPTGPGDCPLLHELPGYEKDRHKNYNEVNVDVPPSKK